MKNTLILAGTVVATLALAGCGSSDSAGGSTPAAGSDIGMAKTNLGQIVVDGQGMTAYYFDKDTANSGTSACTGECASQWPAIGSASAAPKVDGITGKVATIAGTDSKMQITIDGRPIYTFAGDSAAGDTKGQGVGGIWYVVSPDGKEITKDAPTSNSGGY